MFKNTPKERDACFDGSQRRTRTSWVVDICALKWIRSRQDPLITDKEKFTYNSIINFSQKITKGLKERSLILLKCNNCFEILLAYISFNRINCAIILVGDNLIDSSYVEIINAYNKVFVLSIINSLLNIIWFVKL